MGALLVFLVVCGLVCVGCSPKPKTTVVVYPNPADGPVAFEWTPTDGVVVIEVFTAAGRSVATLGAPGASGRAVWTLTDSYGRGVAPGLYLFVFSAPGIRETGRLVVN